VVEVNNDKKPKNSTRRALAMSFVQRMVTLVFSFGSTIILSRLLTPSEIGIFSVAAGLLALVNMLRDFGVSEFLVQERHLDRTLVHTVFTMNLLIAWSLGGILFGGSNFIADFYGDPGVGQVLRVMSLMFFLLPFGTTTQAQLSRELEFGKLAKIHTVGSITRGCTKVALAYAGFSYMSLAWGAVAGMVLTIAGFTLWGWRYRVRGLSFVHWRRVLHFGSSRTVSDVATQLGDQSASLVIGKMLGMTSAGLFSRGYGVVSMYRENIVGAIESVAFPAFAREHREHAKAPELLLKALVYTTGIGWPFFSCGILLAYPVIRILFGDQWDAAVPLMRWLCAAALIGTLMYQCNRFLVAVGRVRTATRVEVTYQIARIGITIAAAHHSLEAVAASQVLVYVLATALYYSRLRTYDVLAIGNCAKALVPSVVVTLATCVVPAAVVFWPGLVVQHMIPSFALAFVGGVAGWLVAIVATRHPLHSELRGVLSRLRARYVSLRA
jgi:O-antigen/teichoic acid export membrane protein